MTTLVRKLQKYLFTGVMLAVSSVSFAETETMFEPSDCRSNPFASYVAEREQFIALFRDHTIQFNNFVQASFAAGDTTSALPDYYSHLIVLNAELIANLYAFYPNWLLHTSLEEYVEQGTDYVDALTNGVSQTELDNRIQFWYTKAFLFADTLNKSVHRLGNGKRQKLQALYQQLTTLESQIANLTFSGASEATVNTFVQQALAVDDQIADIAFDIFVRLLRQVAD